MTKDELARLKTEAQECNLSFDGKGRICESCEVTLALIAQVEKMDAALREIADGARPLTDFEPDNDPWPLDGYTPEDAEHRGREWERAKLAVIANEAVLK